MQYVYCVFGLGFGDIENAWELCSVHATRQSAENAMKSMKDEGEEMESEWQL